jgi:DNA-binding response OmpR family regulator
MTTLLIFSGDERLRERVRMAIGRSPTRGLDSIAFLEADSAGAVIAAVDAGGIDLLILDAEAWPAGGLGVCRELKNSRDDCPPIVVLIARRDDRWLGVWSQADAVLPQPIDAVELSRAVVRLLTGVPVGAATTKETL